MLPTTLVMLATATTYASATIDRCAVPQPPPPPPTPPPPPLTPKTYTNGPFLLDAKHGVELSYNLLETETVWEIQLTANASDAGWLGIGWSYKGQMGDGDFVMGFRNCVKVTSLDHGGTPPPNGGPGFDVSEAGYYEEKGMRVLRFKRGYLSSFPQHVGLCARPLPYCYQPIEVHILYAGGNNAPASCDVDYSTSNYHNEFFGAVEAGPTFVPNVTATNMGRNRRGLGKDDVEKVFKPPMNMSQHTHIEFEHAKTISYEHRLGYTVQESTYTSFALPMASGQIIWTYPALLRVASPGGEYAVLGVKDVSVVDCHNNPVPLTEVYNHHWVFQFYNGTTALKLNPACVNSPIQYFVGVGAETRNAPTIFPDGYGHYVHNYTIGSNIHLLRTTDLLDDVNGQKECAECWYDEYKNCLPQQNGTFSCCFSDSMCKVKPDADKSVKVYYLQYTIIYTRQMDMIKELAIIKSLTPNCSYSYNALPPNSSNAAQGAVNEGRPGFHHLATHSVVAPDDANLLWAMPHMHTGMINGTILLNGKVVCVSYPTYGTEIDVPGNEKGHLVNITECIGQYAPVKDPVKIKKGDIISSLSYYETGPVDKRIEPTPAGPHLVVMGYFQMGFDNMDLMKQIWETVQTPEKYIR